MAFWGTVVKPKKPYTHKYDPEKGRLRICLATLGIGKGEEKSTVQCKIGDNEPIFLCKLIPNVSETCHLELEFEEDEDVVFSVLGPTSVHFSGYFVQSNFNDDEKYPYSSGPYEEELEESDSDASGSFDVDNLYDEDICSTDASSESGDDTDIEMQPSFPQRKSGVVIEEIVEDDKPEDGKTSHFPSKMLSQICDGNDRSSGQLVISMDKPVLLESEDEDGFPKSILTSKKSTGNKTSRSVKIDDMKTDENRKRKIDVIGQDPDSARDMTDATEPSSKERNETTEISKKKKKIKDRNAAEVGSKASDGDKVSSEQNEVKKDDNVDKMKLKKKKKDKTRKGRTSDMATQDSAEATMKEHAPQQLNDQSDQQAMEKTANVGNDHVKGDTLKVAEKKKKKTDNNRAKDVNKENSPADLVKVEERKQRLQSRTFGNGLIIEALSMGKPDGKRASPGKQVFVNYIGKLKKDGKIFDSNVGQRPFKFRLGVAEVIKGWDVGVSGMRVGDKRRLTIPPAMGYGDQAIGKIPKNSTLVFDVELVDVR